MSFLTSLQRLLAHQATVAALSTATLLSLSQSPASALTIQVHGSNYDVQTYVGSYVDHVGYFETPDHGGLMPWWGSSTLAGDFAAALAGGLSPMPLPADGPLFATAYNGMDVLATYYDLSTLGSTDVINQDVLFTPGSVQTYVVLSNPAPVPAPLPFVALPIAFGFARRLRRRQGQGCAGLRAKASAVAPSSAFC